MNKKTLSIIMILTLLLSIFAGCSNLNTDNNVKTGDVNTPSEKIDEMEDGTYNATVKSYPGKGSTIDTLTVQVLIEDNILKEIKTPEYGDTKAIGGMAYDILSKTVETEQSLDIDVISGATISSHAFITALSDCVEKAGGNAEKLKSKKIEKRSAETKSYDTDLLIIGAGITGLSAAIEGADKGADIILLEKNEVLDSSTTRSMGYIQAAGTDLQKQKGIDDSPEAFFDDIYSLYKDEEEIDANLLKIATSKSNELIEFLLDNGVVFEDLEAISPNPPRDTPRNHAVLGTGGGITLPLYNSALDKGVNVMMGTPATELIIDNNIVVGAKATNKYGDDIVISAKNTILAAGSYSADKDLFKKINPLVQAESISGSGDGDGYIFAEKVGADMINLDYAQQMYFYMSNAFKQLPEAIPGSPTSPVATNEVVLLDGGGVRVSNEDEFCFDYIQKVYQGGYIEGWALIGKDFAERYPSVVEAGEGINLTSRDVPILYKSDDIKDLAKQASLNPEILFDTLERYNELCDLGEDEDFNKPAEYLEKINPPYYLFRLPTVVTDGYSGARINENSQVIAKDGSPIKGFYAAGSCAVAQMSSVRYYGCGTSIMIGGVYGRTAAQHAATLID